MKPGAEHRNGAPLGGERAFVRLGVYPARQPAHDRHARIRELVGELPRALQPVVAGTARADDADGVPVPLRERPPYI